MKPPRSLLKLLLVPLWLPALVVVGWAALSSSGAISRMFLPAPLDVLDVLQAGLSTGDLTQAVLSTLWRMAIGWLLASALGLSLAAAISYDRRVAALLTPTLELTRPVPASALIPVAVLAFGLTSQTIVAVIAAGSLWPLLLNAMSGFRAIDPRLNEVSHTVGLTSAQYIWKIALPSALPDIIAGLRLGLTLALILCIVGEMVTLSGGLGAEILMASRNFRSADLFAGIVLVGAIGHIINSLIVAVEHRLLRWQATH